jgi:signal transduction histidine kinase/tetratricopeptide (TPR) repeat protein
MVGPLTMNRTARLRAIRIYLLIILASTLLLFCFSIISWNDQREKARELSFSNLRITGEQMVSDLERRLGLLAADCLSRKNLERFVFDTKQMQSLERLRTYRKQFEVLKRIYPVARHFFVFDGNQLLYPRIISPAHQTLRSIIGEWQSPRLNNYLKLLVEGEHLELQLGQPGRAAQMYHSAEALDVNIRLKAIAAYRKARALQKANQKAASMEAYKALIKAYGDQYDETQTPYLLTMATARGELTERLFPSASQSAHGIYRDLTQGKWELSADQIEILLASLEKRLKLGAGSRLDSNFLEHFQLAKAVSQELAIDKPSALFEIVPQAIEFGSKSYQTFRTSMPGDHGSHIIVGFAVSIPWVMDSLLPTSAASKYVDIGTVSLVKASDSSSAAISDHGTYVTFQTILPFWKLHIASESIRLSEMAASRELWFVGLSAFMFLCVLALGLFLFIGVSWDIRWFQLRSDFVSGVTHEFKTPLSLIRLYSETLATDEQEYSLEDRRNYIRIIARESERMSRLIDNVLDFSKMEQRRKRGQLQEGDLTATVSQAINDYSEYLTWNGFTVKSSIQPHLPPVRFNSEQVSQMILNLMDNARKYSGTSRVIRVNVWRQDSEVVVEVQDKGVGIAPEEKEKIFQPFYRVPKGNEKGGCGLGLYLVDQLMKQHGGRIEVESQENQGSIFRLIFPVSGSKPTKQKSRLLARVRSEQQIQNLS